MTKDRQRKMRIGKHSRWQWAAYVGLALAGGLLGSVIALSVVMLHDGPRYQFVPAWIQAITGVAAAFISTVAVILVSQTLKATEKTMRATVSMVGPKVLLVKATPSKDGSKDTINLVIKNRSDFPAADVKITWQQKTKLPDKMGTIDIGDEKFVASRGLLAPHKKLRGKVQLNLDDYFHRYRMGIVKITHWSALEHATIELKYKLIITEDQDGNIDSIGIQ